MTRRDYASRLRLSAQGALVALVTVSAAPASGAAPIDERAAIARSGAAIGARVDDHRFTDTEGRVVALSELRGRPLVVSLVYTSCYHTCPVLTRRLAEVVEIAREALGEDRFEVITVGFDAPADTPDRMRAFARRYGIDDPRWRFLSGDPDTVSALTETLGFSFAASPRGFDHLAQTTILDAEGRVYRHVYGDAFDPPSIVEPLKELVFGARTARTDVASWIDGVRLFCTIYDPATGRYAFDYSVFVAAITGALSLGALAVFLIHAWREHRAPTPRS